MPSPEVRTVHSAGGVVIRSVEGSRHVLLIRDSHDKWGLPKGHAEAGEALHETALREVSEETGLVDLELGPELMTIDWTFRSRGEQIHKLATFFLMFSERGDPVPATKEGITDVVWVPLESAHQRLSHPNATGVVRMVQAMLLDVGAAAPHTEPRPPMSRDHQTSVANGEPT